MGGPGGTSQGSDSSPGTGPGSTDSGSSGSPSSGSSAGSYSDEALKLTSQGIALFRQGNANMSLDSLNRSLALDPYSEKTWIVTGDVLSAMGRVNESLAAYTKALHLDQADPELFAKIGDLQLASGAYKDAVASYDRALALQPDFPSAVANRTKAAVLASGLVVMDATGGQSPAPAQTVTYQKDVPVVIVTNSSDQPVTTKASLPAVLVLPAFGIVIIFLLNKKRNER